MTSTAEGHDLVAAFCAIGQENEETVAALQPELGEARVELGNVKGQLKQAIAAREAACGALRQFTRLTLPL